MIIRKEFYIIRDETIGFLREVFSGYVWEENIADCSLFFDLQEAEQMMRYVKEDSYEEGIDDKLRPEIITGTLRIRLPELKNVKVDAE